MSTTNGSSNHIDVYQIVTDKIIELLEKGTVPWQLPWANAGMPMNLLSKRPYRGINVWLLSMLTYESNLFITFDQLKKLGGNVKKGEHGHVVVFWKTPEKNQNLDEAEEQTKQKKRTILRYYKVWNITQCDNIPEKLLPSFSTQDYDPIMECESIIDLMPNKPKMVSKESQAYYDVQQDLVNMPKKKTFKSNEGYYSTLFHELVHSTGHSSRVDRKSITEMHEFGGEQYSIEELIAELGSCYLCNHAGILNERIDQSAAYVESWLQKLKSDKRFIVFAAAHAQRGTDYILNIKEYDREREVEQSEVLT